MRRPKVFPHFTKLIDRSEFTSCLTCGTRLRRYATLSERPIITLRGPIRLTHCGYRCPNPACTTAPPPYRTPPPAYPTLPEPPIIPLRGPIRLTHCGYRCPNPACPTAPRSYRSAAA